MAHTSTPNTGIYYVIILPNPTAVRCPPLPVFSGSQKISGSGGMLAAM